MKSFFRHALVAVDLSESSDIILGCLPHFKRFGTENITLFNSVPVSYPGGLSSQGEEEIRLKMNAYHATVERGNFTVSSEIGFSINGYPPAEIVDAAKKHSADFIIIGNRGHSKIHDLFLGSTASETMQRSHLPVYLLKITTTQEKDIEERKMYCARACSESLNHILFPTDFSETAERAFEALTQITAKNTNKITLFHVQSIGRIGTGDPVRISEFNAIDRVRLEERKEKLSRHTGAEINIKICAGSTAYEILREADESHATLIMMGSQGRGYIRELFVGGVAYKVARQSQIPVLTISAFREI